MMDERQLAIDERVKKIEELAVSSLPVQKLLKAILKEMLIVKPTGEWQLDMNKNIGHNLIGEVPSIMNNFWRYISTLKSIGAIKMHTKEEKTMRHIYRPTYELAIFFKKNRALFDEEVACANKFINPDELIQAVYGDKNDPTTTTT